MGCTCDDYNAGMLREPVEFQRQKRTADGAGGYSLEWVPTPGAATMAFVEALSGSERLHAERIEATTRWRLVCRYFPGLLESDRVTIRGRVHNIRFINNVQLRDRWLEIDLDGGVAT